MLEKLEQVVPFSGRKADARVFYLKTQHQALRIFFKQAGAQRDFTVLGKFNGVGGIVEQCLAQACRIATQPAWHAFQIKHDGQALFASLAVNHRAHVVKNGFDVEVAVVQLHFFRLDLG